MSTDFTDRLCSILARQDPVLVVLGGSKGAGKSTFYRHVLARTDLPFINADEIAKTLVETEESAKAYKAMHMAEALRADLLARGISFITETVLSDPSGAKLKAFKTAQERGYYFVFISIVIDGPELSQARVMQRVLAGGHDVPDQKLIERYPRTRENAAKALSQSDLGLVFDNSSESNPYQLMEIWEAGALTWMGSQR